MLHKMMEEKDNIDCVEGEILNDPERSHAEASFEGLSEDQEKKLKKRR